MKKKYNGGVLKAIVFRLMVTILGVGFIGMSSSVFALEVGLPLGGKPVETVKGKLKPKNLVPRLRAAVTVGGDYSDNVNTAPGRDSKGMRFRVTPEVSLQLPGILDNMFDYFLKQSLRTKKVYLEGGYKYGYLSVDGTKVDFHRNAHTANAGLRFNISPKASLGSAYVFQRDQYPFAAAGDTYTINNVNTQLKLELTKRLLVTPYHKFENFNDTGWDADTITDAPYQDYGDNRVGWDTSYKLSPKVTLIGNSEYQHRAFRDNNSKDFNSYGGKGGFAVQLTRKITTSVMGGYERRYFDEKKDHGSAIWDARLQYIPTRKLVMNLFYSYDIQDTFITDFLQDKALPSIVDFIPRQYRMIIVQRIGAGLGINLTDKDRIDTGATYQFERADSSQFVSVANAPKKLDENNYIFNISYAHAFTNWLRLYLEYDHIGRNTNISENFRANLFSFGLRLGW